MNNSTVTHLILLAAACWLIFPAIAAVIAYVHLSISALVWTIGVGAALTVVFEAPRDWVLDRFL